jgi:hypothetical protein
MKQPSRQAWLSYYRHILKCNYSKYVQAKEAEQKNVQTA